MRMYSSKEYITSKVQRTLYLARRSGQSRRDVRFRLLASGLRGLRKAQTFFRFRIGRVLQNNTQTAIDHVSHLAETKQPESHNILKYRNIGIWRAHPRDGSVSPEALIDCDKPQCMRNFSGVWKRCHGWSVNSASGIVPSHWISVDMHIHYLHSWRP